jgi:hypothetical protein
MLDVRLRGFRGVMCCVMQVPVGAQWELVSSFGDTRSRQTLILVFPTAASGR